MATVTAIKCDRCGLRIAEGGRRFRLDLDLAILNGAEHHKGAFFEDLCSEQCLHESVTALTRDVEAMHVREKGD